MTERIIPPDLTKPAEREQKSDHLAAALRANLARRKAQRRAREAASEAARDGGDEQG